MGTGYELAKCLIGTLWELDFIETVQLIATDLEEGETWQSFL